MMGGQNTQNRERTLIVGAGDVGEQILRNIISTKSHFIVGLIDDNQIKQGVTIHGIKVLGKIAELVQ